MTAPLDTAGLVERLRHADQHSPQRVFGSRIFGEAADAIEALSRDLAEARAALERQTDNMAFVLNHASLPDQWSEKFDRDLTEDRTVLSRE